VPLGIRPIVDFVFKKLFGSPENKIALISLLNSILRLRAAIVDVKLLNPFNLQDFEDGKLSVLDIKAVDQDGAVYDIEMQLEVIVGLVQRLVYYTCELYADQLRKGDDYSRIRPVYTICLLNEILWKDGTQGHHAFRLTDQESGRVLDEILEIHTIELPRYTLTEADLKTASPLECWVYWLLHAQEYEPEELLKLFPQPAIQQATRVIATIAQQSEDKAMYDAREKAIRDREWLLNASRREGKLEGRIEGEIKSIRMLQGILQLPLSEERELRGMKLEQLESMTGSLQEKLRNRG
jgi:predicted transposase/invertase (TIGR01784 family)